MEKQLIVLLLISVNGICCLAQSMTSIDFSPWTTNSLNATLEWAGPTDTNLVNVCIHEGNNHRSGYPSVVGLYNYNYQESWFQTWWDDAGVISTSNYTPLGLHVWSGGIDTVLFCFSKQVEGDSNFLYFHQVDFSNTQITIQAYNCGTLLNHNLFELNQSSGSSSFATTVSQATFSLSAGPTRRHLVRFNQDFDFVMVIENNSSDLLALGFMGFGNFNQPSCSFCNCNNNPVLDIDSFQFDAEEISGKVNLHWNTIPSIKRYFIERLDSDESWIELVNYTVESSSSQELYYQDSFPIFGENYYRIRLIDSDGVEHFSKLEYVYLNYNPKISIYPNPSSEEYLLIQFNKPVKYESKSQLKCFDQTGKEFNLSYSMQSEFLIKVDIRLLPNGFYYILVRNSKGDMVSQRVHIQ